MKKGIQGYTDKIINMQVIKWKQTNSFYLFLLQVQPLEIKLYNYRECVLICNTGTQSYKAFLVFNYLDEIKMYKVEIIITEKHLRA